MVSSEEDKTVALSENKASFKYEDVDTIIKLN